MAFTGAVHNVAASFASSFGWHIANNAEFLLCCHYGMCKVVSVVWTRCLLARPDVHGIPRDRVCTLEIIDANKGNIFGAHDVGCDYRRGMLGDNSACWSF